MLFLVLLYHMWKWFVALSALLGIIAGLMSLGTHWNGNTNGFRIFKIWGKWIISVIALLSFIAAMIFTEVPRVYGCTVSEAERVLSEARLVIALPSGQNVDNYWDSVVVGQSEKPGNLALVGSRITLFIQKESSDRVLPPLVAATPAPKESPDAIEPNTDTIPTPEIVPVPQCIGMEQTQATRLLESSGLQVQVWWTVENDNATDVYYVIDQSIPSNWLVPVGTLVKLELSPWAP